MARINVGDQWHYLKVLAKHGRKVTVKCICGKVKEVPVCTFYAARPIKSCGCKRIGLLSKAQTTHGHSTKGNTQKFRTYITWQSMFWRCENPHRRDYKDYGGRGIKVCARWWRFENFLSDMGLKKKGMTLGRKENDGNYEPSNCRWETPKQQARNTRSNTLLRFIGQRKTLSEWAEEFGLHRSTIKCRLKAGLSIKDALTKPLGPTSRYSMARAA